MAAVPLNWLRSFVPPASPVGPVERLRACAGALLGILLTGLCAGFVLDWSTDAVWLIAPMGASAVLLFGVPASPLAQPWSIVGGNVVSGIVGVVCARWIPHPVAAAAVAICVAIGAMFALRCIHPPSGAVALTAVLGGASVHAAGFGFVVAPVALDSFLLLAVALVYNNATGRRYPHAAGAAVRPSGPAATARLGFSVADVEAAAKSYDQIRDIAIDDLVSLFRQTEMHAYRRQVDGTLCRDIMSRDVASVEFATHLDEAWDLMRSRGVRALPVVDRWRHVKGIVTEADFLAHAGVDDHRAGLAARLHRLLARTTTVHSDKADVVGEIMTKPARTATEDLAIVELVPWMSEADMHDVPIVDHAKKLVGVVTQGDLVAALYANNVARLMKAAPVC